MSFWNNPVKSVKNVVSSPGQSLKNGWNSWGRDFTVGSAIGGAMGATGFAAPLAYMGAKYLYNKAQEAANPERTEFNSPADIALSQSMMPTASNPTVRKWTDVAFTGATNAGASPAAAAAAAMRAQTGGVSKMSKIAPAYWQRLMSLALQASNEKNSIPTTTMENTLLKGFLSGGGASGLAQMAAPKGGSWSSIPVDEAGGGDYLA